MSTDDPLAAREFPPYETQHHLSEAPYPESPYVPQPPQYLPQQAGAPTAVTVPWPGSAPTSGTAPLVVPPTIKGTLLGMAPHFLGSLLVVWVVVILLPWWAGTLLFLAWLASGGLVFHRGYERLRARWRLGLRQASPAEWERLAPRWAEVTARFGVSPQDYDLWVENSEDLNAFATYGHTVAVTTRSLRSLSDEELVGVLAHELGHHRAGHTWVAAIGAWYAAPGRVAWALFKRLTWFVIIFAAERSLMMAFMCGIVMFGLALSVAVAMPPLLLVFLTPFLHAHLSRKDELQADRMAAQWGYGTALISAFERLKGEEAAQIEQLAFEGKIERDAMGHPIVPRRRAMARLLASHPELDERITALRAYLASGLSEGA